MIARRGQFLPQLDCARFRTLGATVPLYVACGGRLAGVLSRRDRALGADCGPSGPQCEARTMRMTPTLCTLFERYRRRANTLATPDFLKLIKGAADKQTRWRAVGRQPRPC